MWTYLGLLIGAVLVLLNVRELVYLHSKQADATREFGRESWLVGIIQRSTWSTTLIGALLIVIVTLRQLLGPLPWASLATTLLLIWLLAIPVLRGFEWRRRER